MIPLKPDKPQWRDDDELLHIIAQQYWHSPAFICGTRAGLERLRDAINRALESPRTTQKAKAFCNDGEGYGIWVRCETGGEMALMPLGYTGETAAEPAEDGLGWPHWMIAAE